MLNVKTSVVVGDLILRDHDKNMFVFYSNGHKKTCAWCTNLVFVHGKCHQFLFSFVLLCLVGWKRGTHLRCRTGDEVSKYHHPHTRIIPIGLLGL